MIDQAPSTSRRAFLAAAAALPAAAVLPSAAVTAEDKYAWMADEAIRELELFYEAGWRAGDVLHAILDQPRCLGGLAADRIEDAAGVFDWDVQAVAHHVRDRRPVDRDEADARRRILLDWYSKVNDPHGEVAFARELIATRGNEA